MGHGKIRQKNIWTLIVFSKGASANGEKLMEDCWIMGVPFTESKMEPFKKHRKEDGFGYHSFQHPLSSIYTAEAEP